MTKSISQTAEDNIREILGIGDEDELTALVTRQLDALSNRNEDDTKPVPVRSADPVPNIALNDSEALARRAGANLTTDHSL